MPLLAQLNASPLTNEEILKLHSFGIYSFADLFAAPSDTFRVTGISYEKIKSVRSRLIRENSSAIENILAVQYYLVPFYDTCFDGLNSLLLGGFPTGEICEIFGNQASGKTHLCHRLTAHFAYNNHKVLYIDTDASFSARKVQRFLSSVCDEYEDVYLSRIAVEKVNTYQQFLLFIASLKLHMTTSEVDDEQRLDPDIIIIDSIVTPLVSHYLNSSDYRKRIGLLSTFFGELTSLLQLKKALAIIIVNTEGNWFRLALKNLEYCGMKTTVSVEHTVHNFNEESCKMIGTIITVTAVIGFACWYYSSRNSTRNGDNAADNRKQRRKSSKNALNERTKQIMSMYSKNSTSEETQSIASNESDEADIVIYELQSKSYSILIKPVALRNSSNGSSNSTEPTQEVDTTCTEESSTAN
ncbi:DNA repair protein RAD51-like protein 4 [Leptotrombidium deliense]|uniref:DNA repair protein RAD51-like protein 4 n=1 Tax=Leptotrombidium deliense TaxID=299467 RepID=A0A443SDK9_9ACAR|nr:DNA repair protein RAD51-like protein 4 [Leptotrombidium deliense]